MIEVDARKKKYSVLFKSNKTSDQIWKKTVCVMMVNQTYFLKKEICEKIQQMTKKPAKFHSITT